LLVASAVLYAAFFWLPTVKAGIDFPITATGQEAFLFVYERNQLVWHANLFFVMAWLLLLIHRWLWAAGAAAIAVLLALTHPVGAVMAQTDKGPPLVYLVGYWVWLSSMLLLVLGAFLGWLRWRQ
jgi:hypothetical protein